MEIILTCLGATGVLLFSCFLLYRKNPLKNQEKEN